MSVFDAGKIARCVRTKGECRHADARIVREVVFNGHVWHDCRGTSRTIFKRGMKGRKQGQSGTRQEWHRQVDRYERNALIAMDCSQMSA